MSESNMNAARIAKVFTDFCDSKKYQYKECTEENNLRLDISNLSERTVIKVYNTGTVQIQGKQNSLKVEFEKLKKDFEANPQFFLGGEAVTIKSCSARYDIMLPQLRTKIKESLSTLEATVTITEKPGKSIEYRAKISRNEFSLTLTQFDNGTLWLQGKTDKLFDDACDFIEKIASPSEKEVAARFISSDEKNLEAFTARYTPDLIALAEKNVKDKLGDVYNYLEPYDKKWFVASECLCLAKIPLPEFSPLVMPASKAFEGFAKKLLIRIELFEVDYFKSKNSNFAVLNDKKNPKRIAICNKEKHADTFLSKINVCLDMNRNFMMHSDESEITKVDSQGEAEQKVNDIFKDVKEIFDYFNNLYNLHS